MQFCMNVVVLVGLLWSYRGDLRVIKYLLVIQGIALTFSSFHYYTIEECSRFETGNVT